MKTEAYLYKWTHMPTNRWYIGSRTRKNCHPNDGYICSSRLVKPYILENRSEWVRELICIGEPEYIRILEGRYLELLDAKNDPRSFNKHNGDGKFSTTGMASWNKGKKTGIAPWNKNLPSTEQPFYGKTFSKETCKQLRESQTGSNNSMYGKTPWNKGLTGVFQQSAESNQKRSAKLKGIPRSDEVIAKIRATKAANKAKNIVGV
jgi:hypothetical protein